MPRLILAKWYNKTWLSVTLGLLIFPLGLYGLWKNQRLKNGWKIGLTVLSPLSTLLVAFALILFYTQVIRRTEALNFEAGQKFDHKDYQGAIALYNEALQDDPAYVSAYIGRGSSYRKLGNYRKAIANYSIALEFDSTNSIAFYNRAITKEDVDDYKGAASDYEAALKINPAFAKAYSGRGGAKFILNDYEGAFEDYGKAIKLNPSDASFYNDRGIVKLFLKQYEAAIADFDQAIRINSYAKAFYNRGKAKIGLNQVSSACDDLAAAINLGDKTGIDLRKQYCP